MGCIWATLTSFNINSGIQDIKPFINFDNFIMFISQPPFTWWPYYPCHITVCLLLLWKPKSLCNMYAMLLCTAFISKTVFIWLNSMIFHSWLPCSKKFSLYFNYSVFIYFIYFFFQRLISISIQQSLFPSTSSFHLSVFHS